jgi:predicted nuclease of predicted toxin-antitoxin system
MPQTIRFHLDENVSHAIASGIRRRGIDVTTTQEAGLMGAIDEAHVAFALLAGRVIFTQDEDFLRIHAARIPHPGIA